ncbi:MAG: cytochrome C [Thermodesulfobacteriota bacterium]
MIRNSLMIFLGAALLLFQAGTAAAQDNADNIYSVQPKELTIADCGGCHKAHFGWLKDNGGRHQKVACWDCHEKFHLYNPLKNNYAEIMPKCSQCHELPHGSAEPVTQCLTCHSNPHQPLASLPDPEQLFPNCKLCHDAVAQELVAKPSKHTERRCSECHSKVHGRIPDCSECHQSHSPMVAMETPDCLKCHPVHTPLAISYPEDQAKELCAGCHGEIFTMLQASKAKHSALTCAKCHPTHGEIPPCSRCHGDAPHSPAIHQKFPVCLTCHSNPHDLKI